MENLQQQIQQALTKEKIVLRVLKKLCINHYTSINRGIECGCAYCLAMVTYVRAKIDLRHKSNYYEATYGYASYEKEKRDMDILRVRMLEAREYAKSLKPMVELRAKIGRK